MEDKLKCPLCGTLVECLTGQYKLEYKGSIFTYEDYKWYECECGFDWEPENPDLDKAYEKFLADVA